MSIATQITRLNNNISNMKTTKQEIKDAMNNDFDIIANEQIEDYAELIEGGLELYKDCIPSVETEQATEITVTDAMKYSRNKLELFGNTEQIQYTGKNLANLSISNQVPSTTNGELVTFGGGVCTELIEIDNTKDIVFSYSQTERRQKYVFFYDENQNYLGYSLGMQTNWRLSGNQNYSNSKYVRIRFDSKGTTSWCQLEYNSTATDYEPYVGGQPSPNPDYPQDVHVVTGENIIHVNNTNYPINLGSIELCKIGDYQDYLYKENGNWYKYGAVGNVVLDGSENWDSWYMVRNCIGFYYYKGNLLNNNPEGRINNRAFCDKLTESATWSELKDGLVEKFKICGLGVAYIAIAVNVNRLADYSTKDKAISSIKKYLSDNNILILYILATPTVTQITDPTLISQLDTIYEHLQLSKGKNHITVTASDLKPYMKLSYKSLENEVIE